MVDLRDENAALLALYDLGVIAAPSDEPRYCALVERGYAYKARLGARKVLPPGTCYYRMTVHGIKVAKGRFILTRFNGRIRRVRRHA